MPTKIAAIRYAVDVLQGGPPAEVIAWLARYGIERVQRNKVSAEVAAWCKRKEDTQAAAAPGTGAGEGRNERTADLPRLTPQDEQRLEAELAAALATPDGVTPEVQGVTPSGDPTTAGVTSPGEGVTPQSGTTRGTNRFGVTPSVDDPRDPFDGGVTSAPHGDTPTEEPWSPHKAAELEPNKWVSTGCYLVALMAISISLNTSWRFFGDVFHIDNTIERALMFAVAEMALVACGAGMVVNVQKHGSPGHFRTAVWTLVGASAYMAWAMSTAGDASDGVAQAIGRILLGPILGAMMLHLTLGREMRARHQRTGQLPRIGDELRERFLSRLGLADDDRDAAQRTRDRAAQRAAKLATAGFALARTARLRRAMRAAGVAHDPMMMAKMIAERDIGDNSAHFRSMRRPSPFARFEHAEQEA